MMIHDDILSLAAKQCTNSSTSTADVQYILYRACTKTLHTKMVCSDGLLEVCVLNLQFPLVSVF